MKADKKGCAKEEEFPSVGLQTSLLLSSFIFTLSYGAGFIKGHQLEHSLSEVIPGMGAVTYAMPGKFEATTSTGSSTT